MLKPNLPLELMGVPGSPYTRKMLALLRYRRIPYRLLPGSRYVIDTDPDRFRPRPRPKVQLLPTFFVQNEAGEEIAVCDTTPLIREFERHFQQRPVVPHNPALAFLDYLLEDYADEWLTKAMFHYRWSYSADIHKAEQMLPRWNNTTASDEQTAQRSAAISELQISRLKYVGSNEVTRQTIENSFERFLAMLDRHLNHMPFLLGKRPSACDFAIYGQLTCMALFDPTPQRLIIDKAPRVYAWTESLEDLSGYETLEDDWIEPSKLPDSLMQLLGEVGRLYAPYLIANAEAVNKGHKLMQVELDGRPWEQRPFPYQRKCLQWIRNAYADLSKSQKSVLRKTLQNAGLESLVV